MQNSSSEEWVKPTNISNNLQDINSNGEFEIESILELLHDLEETSTLEELEIAIYNAYEGKVFLDSI